MNIVILDGYTLNPGDLSWSELEQLGTLTVYARTTPEEVVERASEATVILTNKTVLTAAHMKALPQLQYIGVLATGYNVVDIEAAKKQGIVVTNIPAYSTPSVAQMTFALLLSITNRVEHYTLQNKQGIWSRCPDFSYRDTTLTELQGKQFGIVGYGNIGRQTARIAKAFGMNVCAYTSKKQEDLEEGVRKCDEEEFFRTCDIISLHCPLSEQTHHLINTRTLAMMKPSAILLNTGRGPLVDEMALATALSEQRLAAYAADVLSCEPPTIDNPLLQAPNTFITPHIAWATIESRQRLLDICIENVRAFIKGSPQNVVSL